MIRRFAPAALPLALDPGAAFAETVEVRMPDRGETGSMAFDTPGVYGIKGSPHLGMGMVMAARVGGAGPTADSVGASLTARAETRFEEIPKRAGPGSATR